MRRPPSSGNLGYPVALVERDTVGGTVVTSGGAPTKTFREAAAYLSGFEKEKVYGVALSAPPEVMYPAVRARARRVSEQLQQATLERIRERGVHPVHGEARLDGEHTVVSRAADGAETRLHAGRVIIATGSSPLRPAGVPFDHPGVFDSETIAGIDRRPRELLIVGGGAIGVEYATIVSAFGVPVTILDAAARLATMMDSEVSRRLEQVLLARGNRVILGTGMASVRRDGDDLAVELGDGQAAAPGRTAVRRRPQRRHRRPGPGGGRGPGRRARPDRRGLPAADQLPVGLRGRRCDRPVPGLGRHRPGTPGPVRSARPGLLRARRPDPGGGGLRAARSSLCGQSEEDCTAEAIPHETGRCELGSTPRGIIAGQEGLLKLVFHGGTGVLLGVHAIGEIASEIADTGQAMIHNEATVEDVIRTAYNTPTYTYGYKLAASDVLARLHPDVLRAMRLPSRAHRI